MQRSRNFGGRMSLFEEKMKDSRQLVAKDSFQECVKVVHEFLLGLGFPGTINVKSLHTTSPQHFVHVYAFGRFFLKSSYKVPTKELEEETVKLLHDLGYPVALSKNSTCLAVHDPELLGELWLDWLGDWILNWQIVKMMCQAKEKASSSPCDVEEGAEFNEPLLVYCRDTYTKFVEAPDTIDKKDKALLNKLLKWLKLDKKRFIPQQKKNRILMEGLDTLESHCQKTNQKREGCCCPHHNSEKQKFSERDDRESQDQQKDQWLVDIQQQLRNAESHSECGGDGAAGVEQRGAKPQKSQRKGKKGRRKHRK